MVRVRVLISRPKGRGFEPHGCHCVVSLSKNINPSLVLVQPRKTRPLITERLLMGRIGSNQTKQNLIITVFLMSCDSQCSVALPHGAVGWSALCAGHAHLLFTL